MFASADGTDPIDDFNDLWMLSDDTKSDDDDQDVTDDDDDGTSAGLD